MSIFFSCVIISENLFKPFLFVKISFYLCSSVRICFIKYIIKTLVLKCIFWGSNYSNLLIHSCWLVWLLLYVFYQSLHHKQNFCSIDMDKYKLRIMVNWLQSSEACEQRHMLRMIATPREILCFPRQVLGGKYLVTTGMAWHPVSHISAAQWGVGNQG